MVSGTILITGATGGLGRVLTATALQTGRAVIATGRDCAIGNTLENLGAKFIPADLANDSLAALVRGADTVFHLAALSRPWGSRPAFTAANQTATRRLLDASLNAGCERFIYASTPSIYTQPKDQLGITEATMIPVKVVNHYAETKLAAERMVLAASTKNFATLALRPRAIICPHDTVLLPRLLKAANKGFLPLPRNGAALIEPTDARDVSEAFLAAEAVASKISGRAINISGGRPVTIGQLASHVFLRLGKSVRMVSIPRRLASLAAGGIELGAKLLPGKPEPFITRYSAMALGWSQTFNLSVARTALLWEPRHHPFDSVDWALREVEYA